MVFATSSLHSLTHLCPQMFSALSTSSFSISRIDVECINSCLLAFAQRSLSPLQREILFYLSSSSSFFSFSLQFVSYRSSNVYVISGHCVKNFFFFFSEGLKDAPLFYYIVSSISSKEHCSHL